MLMLDIDSYSCVVIIFQTFLVAGGHGFYSDVSSTEILKETASQWIYVGNLPTPRNGLRGANIDQRVLMTGNK